MEDDTLHIMAPANKNVEFRVKTPFGLTDKVVLDDIVLQGSSLALNKVDKFRKEMLEEDMSFLYKYKGYIPVPVLGQIAHHLQNFLFQHKNLQFMLLV